MAREFRFGIGVRNVRSADRFAEKVRRFADQGYDVVHVPDHLGAPAPFPVMMAAADAADIRVGTYVLNAAFYSPALLARDASAVDVLSGGRLELGLGPGSVREEFEAAGIPYPTAGERVAHLRDTTVHLKAALPSVPVLIAGNGDRVLAIAACRADIVGLTGGGLPSAANPDPMGERVEFVRSAAGDRFAELELNLAITAVPTDDSGIPDLSLTRAYFPQAGDAELLAMPTVLRGSPARIADTLRDHRERYGVSYFTVQDYHGDYFAQVIDALR
jgi:probable F420-dependent oxidoreductase